MADISPQPGPQESFLSSSADIVIYGGAAGGGKTYGLLLEGLRLLHDGGRVRPLALRLRKRHLDLGRLGGVGGANPEGGTPSASKPSGGKKPWEKDPVVAPAAGPRSEADTENAYG